MDRIAIRGATYRNSLMYLHENLNLYYRLTSPTFLDQRVNQTKWVILRYPNGSMAQLAGKSQETFEDFFFNVSAHWTTRK